MAGNVSTHVRETCDLRRLLEGIWPYTEKKIIVGCRLLVDPPLSTGSWLAMTCHAEGSECRCADLVVDDHGLGNEYSQMWLVDYRDLM
jgi:hypothetical protein